MIGEKIYATQEYVNEQIAQNGTGGNSSSVTIDTTLSITGAAADAKIVGDKIGNLNSLITTEKTNLVSAINEIAEKNESSIEIDTTLTESGKAADAKITGNALSEKISFAIEQSLTDEQKLTVQKNIGLKNSLSIYSAKVTAADATEITVSNSDITPWDTNVGVGGILLTDDGKLFYITTVTSANDIYSYTAELIMSLKEEDIDVPLYDLVTDFNLPAIPEDGTHIVVTKAITTGVESIASKLWNDLAIGPCQVKFQIIVEGDTLNCSRIITPNYSTEFNSYEINIPARWNQTYGFICLQFAKKSNMIYIYAWYDKMDAEMLQIPSIDDIISVPEYTEDDYGKYLSVNANGPFWNPLSVSEDGSVSTTVQSNWTQNNSDASDYIKNRPFYEGENYSVINTIINNETIAFEATDDNMYVATIEMDELHLYTRSWIKPNTKYKVIIDGIEYIEDSVTLDLSNMNYFYGSFIGENPMLALVATNLGVEDYIPSKPFIFTSVDDILFLILFTSGDNHIITLQELQPYENITILDETRTFAAADITNGMPSTIIKDVGFDLIPGANYKVIANGYEHKNFCFSQNGMQAIIIGDIGNDLFLGEIIQAGNDYIFMPDDPRIMTSQKHIIIKKEDDTILYDNSKALFITTDISENEGIQCFTSVMFNEALTDVEVIDFSGYTFTEGEKLIVSVDDIPYTLTIQVTSDYLIALYDDIAITGKAIGLEISSDSSAGALFVADTTMEYNVKIEGPILNRKNLDSKFIDILPPTIPGIDDSLVLGVENGLWKPIQAQASAGSSLPSVTTADNDKVLMVVNGAWAAASITSGDEVAY